MLIWFAMRDNPVNLWQSGLLTLRRAREARLRPLLAVAKPVDGRNLIVTVKGGLRNPAVRIPTTKLGLPERPGSRVGLTYKVFQGEPARSRAAGATIARDNWITIRPQFTPPRGRTYTLRVEVGDVNGNKVERVLTLVGVR